MCSEKCGGNSNRPELLVALEDPVDICSSLKVRVGIRLRSMSKLDSRGTIDNTKDKNWVVKEFSIAHYEKRSEKGCTFEEAGDQFMVFDLLAGL